LPNCFSICERASSTALARSSRTGMANTPLKRLARQARLRNLGKKHAAASTDSMGL
jgi:hypothetical protein